MPSPSKIGLEPGIVKLFPYQSAWPLLFAEEKKRLAKEYPTDREQYTSAKGPFIQTLLTVSFSERAWLR